MSTVIGYGCQWRPCKFEASILIRTLEIPWLHLCETHREQWHHLDYGGMLRVHNTRTSKRRIILSAETLCLEGHYTLDDAKSRMITHEQRRDVRRHSPGSV